MTAKITSASVVSAVKAETAKITSASVVSAVKADAAKKVKSYLTGLSAQINSTADSVSASRTALGNVFKKGVSDTHAVKPITREQMEKSEVLYAQYAVTISGKELDLERFLSITDIDITETVGQSNTCNLKVADAHWLFLEDTIFVKESPITVDIQANGDTYKQHFEGYISAIDIDFPEQGYPVLSVYCLDLTHLMNRVKKKRSWDNVTSAQVVQAIAQEYGYQCYVDPGYPFPVQTNIAQSDKTDIDFLEGLAKDELDLFVCNVVTETDGKTTVYYVREGAIDSDNAIELVYRNTPYDILSFSPRINKETRQEKSTAGEINTSTKAEETAEVSPETDAGSVEASTDTSSDDASTGTSSDDVTFDASTKTYVDSDGNTVE